MSRDRTTERALHMMNSLLFLLCLPVLGIGLVSEPPELVLQTGHAGVVTCSSFSPDGKTVATSGVDRVVKLWDVETGRLLRTISAHALIITRVAFRPDGATLVTASSDHTAALWDVRSGKRLRTFSDHTKPISALVISPDGKHLFTGGMDAAVKIWDAESGALSRTLEGHLAPISALAVSADGTTMASAATDHAVHIHEIATGRKVGAFTTAGATLALAFSPDGTMISCAEGGSVALREVATGKTIRTLAKHDTEVVSIAFRAGGTELVSAAQGDIRVWRTATGELVRTVTKKNFGLFSCGFSPDGAVAAAGAVDSSVSLWNLSDGKQRRVLKGASYAVQSISFSPDGRLLASQRLDAIDVWDFEEGRVSASLTLPIGYSFHAATFGPVGKVLASGDGCQDTLASLPKATLEKLKIVETQPSVRLWDVETGKVQTTFTGHAAAVIAVAFSPDGRTLASGAKDGKILLWDATTNVTRSSTTAGELPGHPSAVIAIAFHRDGKLLASAGEDGAIRLWDVGARNLARTIRDKGSRVTAIAFSPDGQTLAAGTYQQTTLWETATGRQIRAIPEPGNAVTALAFTPDGTRLVSAGHDRIVRVWNAATGAPVGALPGHSETVASLTFRPDTTSKSVLASSSFDSMVRLWHLEPLAGIATLIAMSGSNWIVSTPDGLFDGSPGAWGQILWRFEHDTFNTAPLETFFNEYFRPGLLGEIACGKPPAAPRDIAGIDRRQPRVTLETAGPVTGRTARLKVHVEEAAKDEGHPAGSGARDVRLFRNGVMVKLWPGSVLGDGGHATDLTTDVTILSGGNQLTAYAFSQENIKSADAVLTVVGARELARPGVSYVLAIGINDYQNHALDLKFAVPDATAMSTTLAEKLGALKTYERVVVASLTNAQATKANIQRALARLAGQDDAPQAPGDPLAALAAAQPEDAVFIYCASHGKTDQDRFYIIPHDTGPAKADGPIGQAGLTDVLGRSLSDLELEQAFRGIDAGHIVMIIDACNSGQLLESDERRRGPMNSKGLAQLAYEKGMFVLTAAQSQQAALETERLGHGYLTYALVEEGMKNMAADTGPHDGKLAVGEWFNFATRRVPLMQLEERRSARGLNIAKATPASRAASVQRPRMFFRREAAGQSLIVSRDAAPGPH